MAKRIKSGLKHLRQSAKRRLANMAVKSRIKTLMRSAASGDPHRVAAAQAALDKAARRGVIHPNTAARKKSRLMRRRPAPAA
ncbi:MAG: 30S ribosomal protein S20 [Armatimonadota bacterium]|nr:30S ribosomal protein S20 [Armatimonadota bacterium]MDR7519156.1 30S ribosomal protein S20 [Armatimonadota bacterium]MDR7551266.1 30S ribosomal protein S20 [Armatimonadota bacterium]